MPITPQDVANADQIDGLALSEAGDRVVYCVGPAFRHKDAQKTQALWIADIGVPESARQITSGLFNDHSPTFDPKSGDVFFLSDRHKAGGAAQVYRLSSAAFGGDAMPLTPTTNIQGVSAFKISPDGRWLAFISPDEPTEKEEETKEAYVIIWRAAEKLGRLRILDLSGQIEGTRTVVSVDSHVQSFAWSPDSARILYRLAQLPDLESSSFPISEHILSVEEDDGDIRSSSIHVVTHNRALSGDSVWAEHGKFYFLHAPDYTSAPALWVCKTESGATPTRVAFGESDDAVRLFGIGSGVAVEVAFGLETRIDLIDSDTASPVTAFETSEDAFSDRDLKQVDGKCIFVVVRSSGVTGEAENVWCGSTGPGTKGVLSTKLSAHHKWMSEKEMPQSTPFYWSVEDGTALQGIMAYPRGQKPKNMPTVVVPHGGPYLRDLVHMRISKYSNYRYLLASHGFLVLSPNYRGSQGRGTDFARTANGGMGALDYADVESMLAAAIERGYTDRENVAIAGYSQGGFLSAWGCTRPTAIWKAGVIGAGPTDWGSLIICSDLPDVEADLGGTAPWSPREPHYLQGSPIRDVRNVKAPLLVIHGEKDERVPLTQAIGFMRGLVREADKSVSDASTLVIYPREGHPFQERAHIEDQLTRVLAHIQKYLA
ncbi:Alpha/Beta hydrolase protein [Mycena rosella]|uniref:Dipeptidyl-peptidase V n=1 Tax=Mycena rosella TaxID=1033263 RepID=A0AAD7GM60_MYCRO|nr:Alpha/Beta hydrolase protein [Mycena rosella]